MDQLLETKSSMSRTNNNRSALWQKHAMDHFPISSLDRFAQWDNRVNDTISTSRWHWSEKSQHLVDKGIEVFEGVERCPTARMETQSAPSRLYVAKFVDTHIDGISSCTDSNSALSLS